MRKRYQWLIYAAFLLLLPGCNSPKTLPVAESTPGTAAAPAVPTRVGATPNPHPWIGNQPPPGSAMPPGGPKIPHH